jgi:hypothetical protein
MFKYLKIVLLFCIIMTTSAQAYLDPGTGSMIVQAILGFIAAILSYFYFFWNKVKNISKKIFSKFSKKKNG